MNQFIILLGYVCCALAGFVIGKEVQPMWRVLLLSGITGYCLMALVFIPWSEM